MFKSLLITPTSTCSKGGNCSKLPYVHYTGNIEFAPFTIGGGNEKNG